MIITGTDAPAPPDPKPDPGPDPSPGDFKYTCTASIERLNSDKNQKDWD